MASASAVADLGKRLLEASRKGTAEEVSHLMATGAPLTTDWLGTSPLHLAAQYGHTSTADVLLRAGVSRDGKTKVDKTPLHLACQHGHIEIVKMLVKHGAAVHVCDMLSMTPLHWTCERNYPEITKILLEAGARTDTKNKFGKTPIDIAKSRGHTSVLQLLKQDYTTSAEARKRQLETNSVYNVEVRKRARTRKFPMTAGSWAGGDSQADPERHRQEKARRASQNQKRKSGEEENGRLENERADPENNLSSLVSAAAIVRSKSIDDPKFTAVTAALNQNSADSSVLDTLATLATCAASGAQGTPGSHALPAIAPGYITLSNLQGLQANGSNLLATNSLGANIPAGLVGGIQLAPPITLNMIQGLGGRLQVGQQLPQVIASSSLPQMIAPNVVPQVGATGALAHVVNRDGTTQLVTGTPTGGAFTVDVSGNPLNQSVQVGAQDILKTSELPPSTQPTTLSIVGSIPSQHTTNKSIAPSQGQAITSVMSVGTGSTSAPQTYPHAMLQTAGVPQGSIPVNIPVSLLNSLIAGGVVQAQGNTVAGSEDTTGSLLPRSVSSETQTPSPTSLATIASNTIRIQSPQQTMVAGSSTPISVVPLAGLGGVQLIPNQALFSQQFVTALRPITPLGGTAPMLQQQGILAGSTIPIPVAPVNLSSILPTAVSLAQLPIAQQQVVTTSQIANQGASSAPVTPGFQIDTNQVSSTMSSSSPITSTPAVLSLQNFVNQETSLPRRTLPNLNTTAVSTSQVAPKTSLPASLSSGLNLISALVKDDTAPRTTIGASASGRKDSFVSTGEKETSSAFKTATQSQHKTQMPKKQLFPQLQQLLNQQHLIESTSTQELQTSSLLSGDKIMDDDAKVQNDSSEQFESQVIAPRVVGNVTSEASRRNETPTALDNENNSVQVKPTDIPQGLASLLNIVSVSSGKTTNASTTSPATDTLNNDSENLMKLFEQARVDELTREELKKQLAEAERKSEQYRERLEKAQKEISEREERERQKERLEEILLNQRSTNRPEVEDSGVTTASLNSLFSQATQGSNNLQLSATKESMSEE